MRRKEGQQQQQAANDQLSLKAEERRRRLADMMETGTTPAKEDQTPGTPLFDASARQKNTNTNEKAEFTTTRTVQRKVPTELNDMGATEALAKKPTSCDTIATKQATKTNNKKANAITELEASIARKQQLPSKATTISRNANALTTLEASIARKQQLPSEATNGKTNANATATLQASIERKQRLPSETKTATLRARDLTALRDTEANALLKQRLPRDIPSPPTNSVGFSHDQTEHQVELTAEVFDEISHREKILKDARADIISKAVIAQDANEDDDKQRSFPHLLLALLCAVLVCTAAIVGGVCGSGKCGSSSEKAVVPSQDDIIETIRSATLLLSNTTTQYKVGGGNESLTPQESALQYVVENVENVPDGLTVQDSWRLVQRYALCVFLYSTNGDDDDKNQGTAWFSLASHDECAWSGVLCADSRVVGIAMPEMNLGGTLPPDIGLLTDLEVLSLGHNVLSGSLPTFLSTLTNLQVLDIEGNAFTGSLFPPPLKSLQLKQYIASRNEFTGTIPPALGSQTQLNTLDIKYNNNLEGSIPASLGELTGLTFLHFGGGSALTGTLPTFLPSLTNLQNLAIEASAFCQNSTTQLLPLTQLSQLTHLRMTRTYTVEQAFPPDMGQAWPNMEHFAILRNKITGTLPEDLAAWTALKVFFVSYNEITGTIPAAYFDAWSNLEVLSLGSNRISGTLPTSIGSLSNNMKTFDISQNEITGTLPTEVGVMTDLDFFLVSLNRFGGTIPVGMRNFSPLSEIWMSQNNFTGTAPFCQTPISTTKAEVDCDKVDCPCCTIC